MTGEPTVHICSSQKTLRVPRRKITRLVAFVARSEGAALLDVDIAVVGADEMARLNERYHGYVGPTDVLSFDLSGPRDAGLSAEIVVCSDVAVAEAAKRDGRPQNELLLYVVHGLLHLLGYDDPAGTAEAEWMHVREAQLLDAFKAER